MAIPKIMGIENEYGIYLPQARGSEWDEERFQWAVRNLGRKAAREWLESEEGLSRGVLIQQGRAASKIVDAIRGISQDFENTQEPEEALQDFSDREIERAFQGLQPGTPEKDRVQEIARSLGVSGRMLGNGARFYVDMRHPEYSTAECLSARDLVIWNKAGERIVNLCRKIVEEESGTKIEIHKDNSDRAGNTFAAHENYSVEPETFREITQPRLRTGRGIQLTNFLVARQILVGAGKAGAERGLDADYQLSQRADFVEATWAHETDIKSIINCRDRAYADPRRFRRLHVILGDANLCEYALFLKVGLTAIFLKMLEDNFIARSRSFLTVPMVDPVIAVKVVSRDLNLRELLPLENGKRVTGLDIIEESLRLAHLYFEEAASPTEGEIEVLQVADFFLEKLKTDFSALFGYSDWVTKYVLLQRLQERTGQPWDSDQPRRMDYRYHNVDPEAGLYYRLDKEGKIKHLVSEPEILAAVSRPPQNTRAYLRSKLIEHFGHEIRWITWQCVRFRNFRMHLESPLIGKEAADQILTEIPRWLAGHRPSSDIEDIFLEFIDISKDDPRRILFEDYLRR